MERTNSTHSRFGKLLVRFNMKSKNQVGFVHQACYIIVNRRISITVDPMDFPVSYLMTLIQKMVRSFQDRDVLTNPLPS